jgi:hypothetical protein
MKALSGQLLLICIVSTILFVSTGLAHADKSAEINHLLEFIAQSDCIYIRNGKEYSSLEARDHIAGKYESVKWRIKTSETFISKIASSSSLSGKQYMIRCKEEEQTTEQWLSKELENYRSRHQ